MGKGSTPRPGDSKRAGDNMERIFGPKAPQRCWNCGDVRFIYKNEEWTCRECGQGAQR